MKTMSSSTSEILTSTVLPSVMKVVDAQIKLGPISIVVVVFLAFILSIFTVGCNSIILVAFYRYKRLRTASNCLLASLAVSDFGVGVFIPFGTYLELTDILEAKTESRVGVSSLNLCIVPYCVLIALCNVSILVNVAIAVDRLTSLVQPLRYNNIITHSSIEKYIAGFWIYATAIGLSPLIYARVTDVSQIYSGSCRFSCVIMPPVRVFLFLAVWAPSAFILLGCYMYVYVIARAHARAIYTVELSFRNQRQTLVLPRYGQTLAVTVGAFYVLWIPFQTCMLLDTFCGTNIVSNCTVWLGLPILIHSGTNPWVYAFHHGEMRIATGKIVENLINLFSAMPNLYGCSRTPQDSNSNHKMEEINNSNEGKKLSIENCCTSEYQDIVYSNKQCFEVSSTNTHISSENIDKGSSKNCKQVDIIENINDLTKMLDPKYVINRNHVIDRNHNIDKIRNFKYLLDPTFSKIRHVRKLNHKKLAIKNIGQIPDSHFISFQNLKTNRFFTKKNVIYLNTISDPVLNTSSYVTEMKTFNDVIYHRPNFFQKKALSLCSISDFNMKNLPKTSCIKIKLFPINKDTINKHTYSVQNLNNCFMDPKCIKSIVENLHLECDKHFFFVCTRQRIIAKYSNSRISMVDLKFQETNYIFLPMSNLRKLSFRVNYKQRISIKHLKYMLNRFHFKKSKCAHLDSHMACMSRFLKTRKNSNILKHSESINTFHASQIKRPESSKMINSVTVPTIYSKPMDSMDNLGNLLQENNNKKIIKDFIHVKNSNSILKIQQLKNNSKKSKIYSNCRIYSVLININNYREQLNKRIISSLKKSKSENSVNLSNILLFYQNGKTKKKINNFEMSNSLDSIKGTTSCLNLCICSDALNSSFNKNFLSAPSTPDSGNTCLLFKTHEFTRKPTISRMPYSKSNTNILNKSRNLTENVQTHTKSNKSVLKVNGHNKRSYSLVKSESNFYQNRPKIRTKNCEDSKMITLTTLSSKNIFKPTFEITLVSRIKNNIDIGVNV